MADQISDPLGVLPVGLAPGDVADVTGIPDDQLDVPLQHGITRPPVDAGALHADMRRPCRREPIAQCFEFSPHRAKRAYFLARPRACRADQQAGDHCFLVHVEPATPLDDCLHPRLPSSEGDRDAAGTFETLPHVLPVPGATKNSTSMQRGPDCLSGSQATQNVSASTRSPIGGSDKPTRAATIFNHNGARPAQLGCLVDKIKRVEMGWTSSAAIEPGRYDGRHLIEG